MLTPYALENESRTTAGRAYSADILAFSRSKELFGKLRTWARLNRLLAWLIPGRDLEDLSDVVRNRSVSSQHYAGLRRVPIHAIIGSESKSQDFDRSFNPRHDHQMQRWLRVAQAYRVDGLPPVELVEVAGRYFVRDGHHRISVARAMGAVEIDAEVVVWELGKRQSFETSICPAAV